MFSHLPPDELERRRLASVKAWQEMQRAEWEAGYQEKLDRLYWKTGKCCAGCDHWASDQGFSGACTAAPPVSGWDVLRSAGIDWASYVPAPGHPFTHATHVCGAFKDDFDWSTLPAEYLKQIGAKA
ncbi:MAG: hypothetical protein EBS50_12030 [Sphingomonadaceae bacterium]|nr:hypothetical protein [Sphingomonadaceae bacterium]